jgi:3D (Asp-Asp-Asp) domain-containing protein
MNKRWKNKIDIFMGNDREKALKWGKRKVRIYWRSSSQDKE